MEKQDIGIIDFADGLPLQSGILKVPEDLDVLAGWLSKREHRIRIDEQDFPIVRYKEKLSLIHVTATSQKYETRCDAFNRELGSLPISIWNNSSHLTLYVSASSDLTMDEMEVLCKYLNLKKSGADIKWGLGIDKTLGNLISLVIVYSNKK